MSSQISIKQLPQITEINEGDLILVQTPNATNTLLFENFIIGLDNTTFGTTVTQNSTDIGVLSSNIETLSSNLYGNDPTTITSQFSGIPITINGTTYNLIVSAS